MNPRIDRLYAYPFERLRALLEGTEPPPGASHIPLSITGAAGRTAGAGGTRSGGGVSMKTLNHREHRGHREEPMSNLLVFSVLSVASVVKDFGVVVP